MSNIPEHKKREYEDDLLADRLDYKCYHVDGIKIDDKELVKRIQAGDEAAKHLLLSNNEKFLNGCAADIADRYGVYHLAPDLKQEGALAMLKAAERFDFSRGVKFLTYAYPIVKSAVLDYAAETTMPVRLPPARYHQIRKVSWILAVAPPGTKEPELLASVMEELSVSRKVALSLMSEARSVFDGIQLGERADYLSYGGDPAARYAAKLRQNHISELLSLLTPRERMLIQKYCGFGESDEAGLTFEELAVRFNFNSASAAEKAFCRAVSKLAALYGKTGEYSTWREAARAVHRAKQEAQEPEDYSTPQGTWYEDEWTLVERFPELVRALIAVFTIMHDALEKDSATQPAAEAESTIIP